MIGFLCHHSSSLSPLYSPSTRPHCTHCCHWYQWRFWSLSGDVWGRIIPNADGSSSNGNRRNTWCVDQSTITTHSSEHCRHYPFVHRSYASHRRDYCRNYNNWGWFGGATSKFIHKLYKCYIRTRVHIGVWHVYWHEPMPTMNHTTIKWDRSAVSMRGWWEEGIYSRHYAWFLLFWYIKNGVIFPLFWYQWHQIDAWEKTTINKPFFGAYRRGLWCFLGMGGW